MLCAQESGRLLSCRCTNLNRVKLSHTLTLLLILIIYFIFCHLRPLLTLFAKGVIYGKTYMPPKRKRSVSVRVCACACRQLDSLNVWGSMSCVLTSLYHQLSSGHLFLFSSSSSSHFLSPSFDSPINTHRPKMTTQLIPTMCQHSCAR